MLQKIKIPHILLGLYIMLFTILAVAPFDRAVWWAENIPIMAIVALLILLYPRIRFSNTAYVLMSVLIYMHTFGGHFTFARVPFGAITDFFGFERNHYDRIAHFSVGFYAFAVAELLLIKQSVRSRIVLFTYPVLFIVTVAALYELFEWQFAVLGDPQAGAEVLGSQGDIWDAQKDILADTLGAIAAMVLFRIRYRGRLRLESD